MTIMRLGLHSPQIGLNARDFVNVIVNRNAALIGEPYIVIRTFGFAGQAQDGVTVFDETARSGMQNLIVEIVADGLASGYIPNGQGDPLAYHRDVTGLKDGPRGFFQTA